jgi:uncharacterized protein DUF3108
MTMRGLLILVTGTVGLLALTSGSPQAQSAEPLLPFKVGETLSYDISWSTFLSAGRATVTVKERRQLSAAVAAYNLVAEGRPTTLLDAVYHLYYKAESLFDTRALRPTLATLFSDEGGRRQVRTTRFVDRTTIDFQSAADAPHEKHIVPEWSQDPLSSLYALRAFPIKSGAIFPMVVVDGTDIYKLRWQIAGPEPISSALGSTSAWRASSMLSDEHDKPLTNKRVTIWLSNDARKLPLKLQVAVPIGDFVLTLSKVMG